MARAEIEAFIAKHGLVFTSRFVPFSQTDRERLGGMPTLNWDVTVSNSRQSFTVRFTAGCANCPSYVQTFGPMKHETKACVEAECERGYRCVYSPALDKALPRATGKAHRIEPDSVTVLANLTSDARALDCPTFEHWAAENEQNPDSRAAEATYRQCLSHGLNLKALVGWEGLAELEQAARDF